MLKKHAIRRTKSVMSPKVDYNAKLIYFLENPDVVLPTQEMETQYCAMDYKTPEEIEQEKLFKKEKIFKAKLKRERELKERKEREERDRLDKERYDSQKQKDV